MSKYSYSKSGVSIDKGNQFVSEIKKIIKKNKVKNIKTLKHYSRVWDIKITENGFFFIIWNIVMCSILSE